MEKYNVSYYNLLIFTIISSIFCILLTLILYYQGIEKYMPFLVTLISGVVLIIFYYLIVIYLNDKERDEQLLSFYKCPEYYNKKNIGGKEICTNDSLYYDQNNKQYIMKIYPASAKLTTETYPLPSKLDVNYRPTDNKYEKFPLDEINSTVVFNSNTKKCSPIKGTVNDKSILSYNNYSLTPWTNIKSQCSSVI